MEHFQTTAYDTIQSKGLSSYWEPSLSWQSGGGGGGGGVLWNTENFRLPLYNVALAHIKSECKNRLNAHKIMPQCKAGDIIMTLRRLHCQGNTR